MEEDGFTIVKKNKKVQVPCTTTSTTNSKSAKIISKQDVFDNFTPIIKKYKAFASILYGSTANGNNKKTSDIDVMIFWKKVAFPSDDALLTLKQELESVFDKHVDMVVMIKDSKFLKPNPLDEAFLDNVKLEGIFIFNNSGDALIDLIDESIKYGKI